MHFAKILESRELTNLHGAHRINLWSFSIGLDIVKCLDFGHYDHYCHYSLLYKVAEDTLLYRISARARMQRWQQ